MLPIAVGLQTSLTSPKRCSSLKAVAARSSGLYIILKAVMLWARFLQYFSSCACRLPRLLEPFVWGLTIICLLCWGHRLDPVGSCVSFAKRTDRVKRAQANDSRGLSPRGRRSHKLESCLMLKACSNNRIFGHALPPSIMKQLASPP